MLAISPKLSQLLTQATQTPDLETALWKVLSEYVDLKTERLNKSIAQFEEKWGMSFNEFARRSGEGKLVKDIYSWEVEQDFWQWEQAVTLLEHYRALKL